MKIKFKKKKNILQKYHTEQKKLNNCDRLEVRPFWGHSTNKTKLKLTFYCHGPNL